MTIDQQLGDWHDFYTAIAGVSGVLVGLLFVALALSPSIMGDNAPAGLRAWCGETFHALVVMLVFSLLFLIPAPTGPGLGIPILILAATGFRRLFLDMRSLRTGDDPQWSGRTGLNRFGPALGGYASAAVVGLGLLLDQGEFVDWMMLPIFLLLINAATNCWEILKVVGSQFDS